MSDNFYEQLPVLDRFEDTAHYHHYTALADDWAVAVADVQGSTAAMARGLYKEINTLAVSVISGVVNALKPMIFPYIFGGDGATLAFPEKYRRAVSGVLKAAVQLAREEYGLTLQTGIVGMTEIRAGGVDLRVARFKVSPPYTQCVFMGGGAALAERMVKEHYRQHNRHYGLDPEARALPVDFSGLECRWKSIPSPHGETVAYLIQAIRPNPQEQLDTYRKVMALIESAYGDAVHRHPVTLPGLTLTGSTRSLRGEIAVRSFGRPPPGRWLYTLWLKLQIIIGRVIMARGLRFKGANWGHYKQDLVANTDVRKLDDMLRLIVAGTTAQRESLLAQLKSTFKPDELLVGWHVSQAAVITCLIEDYEKKHIHFVDSEGGGYAQAAVMLKSLMK